MVEAKRLNIPVLNLDPVFREYLNKHPEIKTLWRPREIGGHLSEEGNKVTARAIYNLLESQRLLVNDKTTGLSETGKM